MIYFLAYASGWEKRWENAQCATSKLTLQVLKKGAKSLRDVKLRHAFALAFIRNASSGCHAVVLENLPALVKLFRGRFRRVLQFISLSQFAIFMLAQLVEGQDLHTLHML